MDREALPSSVVLDSRTSPVHALVKQFLEYSMRRIEDIARFYAPKAVFSITCSPEDLTLQNVPLSRESRNLIFSNDEAKLFVGPQLIARVQEQTLFKTGFVANVSRFTCNQVSPELHSFVLYGYFSYRDRRVAYARSLLVGELDREFRITNDHLFIFGHDDSSLLIQK